MDIFLLNLFKQLPQNNVPREVRALNDENVVIFTDACYERDDDTWPCGLCGVLCWKGQARFFFCWLMNVGAMP